MAKYYHYLAVRFTDIDGLPKVVALFGTRDNINFHWSGGPSYTTKLKDWEIVKDYGTPRSLSGEDRILAQFDKDFPPEPYDITQWPFKPVSGFVSPEGVFYRCCSWGHSNLAEELLLMLNAEAGINREDSLNELGWLTVRSGFISGSHHADETVTNAQLRWICELYYQNEESAWYRSHIEQFLDYLS